MPDRSSAAQLALLVGGTFLVVATLGRFCESTKGAYKRYFLAIWALLARRLRMRGRVPAPSPAFLAAQLSATATGVEASVPLAADACYQSEAREPP